MVSVEVDSASPEAGPAPLWTARQLTAILGVDGLGLILVAVGAYGSGGVRDLGEQMPWVEVAIAGVGLSALGHSIGYRLARSRIHRAAARVIGRRRRRLAPRERAVKGDALVAATRMQFFHLATCPFAAGKAIEPSSRADHERAGRRPCEVCQP
jgi:hypothetical protein